MTKTWTRNDLIEQIHSKVGLSLTDSSNLIEDIFNEILVALEKGDDVKLSSFGTFLIKNKNSRIGRNPKTGVEANISARKVVTFNPSNLIRKKVK
tara:strand:- start:1378 stop:1662 length:285 start_codon:yes stop_codon:yes gene_type:complete